MAELSKNKKHGLIIGGACLAILVLLLLNGNKEHPYQITNSRLKNLEQAVVSFMEEKGRVPEGLSELDLPEEELKDHLGEPFIYRVDKGSITILSYGSDRKPGGRSFRRDYKVIIDITETNLKSRMSTTARTSAP